jgi:hypothetical protein
MNKKIMQILNMYPEGIFTIEAAAQTMAALVSENISWHWDEDPRQCGFTTEEGEALHVVSWQLWEVACLHFPGQEGETPDTPMWEGLMDGLDPHDGIQAFRADNDPVGSVYVATSGIIVKVPRAEWRKVYDAYIEAMGEDEDSAPDLLEWLHEQPRWTPPYTEEARTSAIRTSSKAHYDRLLAKGIQAELVTKSDLNP